MYQVGVGEKAGVYVRRGVPLIKNGVTVSVAPPIMEVPSIARLGVTVRSPGCACCPPVPVATCPTVPCTTSFVDSCVSIPVIGRIVTLAVGLGKRCGISPLGTQDWASKMTSKPPMTTTAMLRRVCACCSHTLIASDTPVNLARMK